MSALEAMRNGLPIVATRVGGLPSVVDHGVSGLLTSPGDIDAFSAAMLRLATHDSERIEMGRRAFERVRKHFSIEVAARKYEELYRLATHGENLQ